MTRLAIAFFVVLSTARTCPSAGPQPEPAQDEVLAIDAQATPAPSDTSAAAGAAQRGYEDVVFFDKARPIVLRIRGELGGTELHEAWKQNAERTFAYLDIDKSGRLSNAELARASWLVRQRPPERDGLVKSLLKDIGLVGRAPTEVAEDVDLATYIERSRAGQDPFMLSAGPGNAGAYYNGYGVPIQADVFEVLDTDQDQRLSTEELAATATTLARYDATDDAVVSVLELAQFRNPFDATLYNVSANGMATVPSGDYAKFVRLGGGPADHDVAARIVRDYTRAGRYDAFEKLTPASKASREAFCRRIDADADGTVTVDEAEQFVAQHAADVEIAVRIAADSKKPKTEMDVRSVADDVKIANSNKAKAIETTDARCVIPEPPTTRYGRGDSNLAEQFDMSDKDKNGMLEMSEVEGEEPNVFRQSFALFDYNSDGKLTKDECTTWQEHYRTAYTTRLVFGAADHGVQLFALLDTNEDQRIAGREIRNGIEWLKRWDVDGDSGVAVEELPTRYVLTFGQGQAAPIGNGNVNGVFVANSNIQPAERSKDGPLWFRRMDRNRDGDLSRGEFLGPMADFDRLDRDSDGLVDASEAAEL